MTFKTLDMGVIELRGPFGLSNQITQASRKLRTGDTGVITRYGLYIVLGILILRLIIYAPGVTQNRHIQLENTENLVIQGRTFVDLRLVIIYIFALTRLSF